MAGELAFIMLGALFVIIFFRSEISKWRRNKKRQQLDSKTPFDYALQNAKERNSSLTKKLSVVRETQRIEAQNKLMEDALERELRVESEDSFRKLHESNDEAEARRIHMIRTADTLSTIAKEYGTTADELIKINLVRHPRDLAVGNTLIIPEED